MSYVVSTASKSPFAKPKKHSQWESFPPVAQLLFPFDNSLYFVMVKYIQLACEQALWRALFLSPTPRAPRRASGISDSFTWIQGAVHLSPAPGYPRELAGSRIPLAESRGCCPPPPGHPGELAGFRIPLAESRVLSLAHRESCSQTNIQPRLIFKSPWEKFRELQEGSVLYLFHIWLIGQ